VEDALELLASSTVRPTDPGVSERLVERGIEPPRQPRRLAELLARPRVLLDDLLPWIPEAADWPRAVVEEVASRLKYAGYIERQQRQVERMHRTETLRLPVDLSYGKVAGLSFEVREKLRRVRPETLGQAGRIPGITPAAITALLAHLRMREKRGTA
jgi:tRNA uridine 5-carboxymethylaminomethyl modification enzyme